MWWTVGVALGAPVYMPLMTTDEVRAALDAGVTTVLVPTGGIEANGPFLTDSSGTRRTSLAGVYEG